MTPMGFAVEIIAAIKRIDVIVHKILVFVKTFNIFVDTAYLWTVQCPTCCTKLTRGAMFVSLLGSKLPSNHYLLAMICFQVFFWEQCMVLWKHCSDAILRMAWLKMQLTRTLSRV